MTDRVEDALAQMDPLMEETAAVLWELIRFNVFAAGATSVS